MLQHNVVKEDADGDRRRETHAYIYYDKGEHKVNIIKDWQVIRG